ncbi:MAG: hypothetical protein K8L99_06045 [Anaerolineae bacterium]|nr:hypothetical protein [Anaerolineae bacterium]
MNADWVKNTLRTVQRVYKPILDVTSTNVIDQAIGQLEESHESFIAEKSASWGYMIFHDFPLRFKPSPETGYEPVVDIYCDIQWTERQGIPAKQDIKVRAWCTPDKLGYREDFDSLEICDKLTSSHSHPGRVISRFHFDRVNNEQGRSNQYHPRYHIQVGGNAPEYELSWFPKGFDLPRISYHPMELFLTCQFVAANFFTEEYASIREKGEWKTYLWQVQKTMLAGYYEKCLSIINSKDVSLLDGLEESLFDEP